MRKTILIAFISIAGLVFSNDCQIMTIDELISSELLQKMQNMPEKDLIDSIDSKIILLLKKGNTLPIKMFLNGEYFHLITDEKVESEILVKKDLYITIKNNNYMVSENLKNWEEIPKFFGGNINFTVKSSKDIPLIELTGEINKK